GALRRLVGGGERRKEREADERFLRHRAVGADAERRVGLAAPDRLDAKLDRGRARRAGGGERDGRALGAERFGKLLGDRIELEALVELLELRGGAQQFVISDRVVRAACLGERAPLRPLDLDRRDGEKERAREIALAADPCLIDRFFGGDFAQPFAQGRRRHRLDRQKVHRARDAGLELLDRKPGDLADAGFSRGELRPVVLLPDAERGDDADPGCHHDGAALLVAHCRHCCLLYCTASSSAMPSPRTIPTLVTTSWLTALSMARSTPLSSPGGNSLPWLKMSAASA